MNADRHSAILLLELEIFIPGSNSLKQKRKVIRSLKERLMHRFNISVAETGYMDKWQRSVLSVVMVSSDHNHLKRAAQNILRFAEMELVGKAEIVNHTQVYP